MEEHEYAGLFPAMDEGSLHELAEDIKLHGQHEPIVLLGGKVLDGRNRLRACEIAGVEPRFSDYGGDDAFGYVISLNLRRRHLTESQRAMVAAKIANRTVGGDHSANLQNGRVTSSEAADRLNVSERSVNTARSVRNGAHPALVEAVELGQIAVSVADKVMKAPSLAPLMSSDSDEWYTPDHIWQAAARVVGAFDLDAAAEPDSGVEPNIPAAKHYRKENDALRQEWHGRVWLNPPYSDCKGFANKLIEEWQSGRCEQFMVLVPARTDTQWWQTLTAPAPISVCFVTGRLKFKGGENSAPFPSALIYGGGKHETFKAEMTEIGSVWRRA